MTLIHRPSVVVSAETAAVLQPLLKRAIDRAREAGAQPAVFVELGELAQLGRAWRAHEQQRMSAERTSGRPELGAEETDGALWVSSSEFAALRSCSERHASRMAKDGKVRARMRAGRWEIRADA